MPDYIALMRRDTSSEVADADWAPYLETLRAAGALRGGSAIGDGICVRRDGGKALINADIVGFIRIEARDLDDVTTMLAGNPVYEAGGTIEIRELPRTD